MATGVPCQWPPATRLTWHLVRTPCLVSCLVRQREGAFTAVPSASVPCGDSNPGLPLAGDDGAIPSSRRYWASQGLCPYGSSPMCPRARGGGSFLAVPVTSRASTGLRVCGAHRSSYSFGPGGGQVVNCQFTGSPGTTTPPGNEVPAPARTSCRACPGPLTYGSGGHLVMLDGLEPPTPRRSGCSTP